MGLGDRVVIKKMPESMPENPYDNFQVFAPYEEPQSPSNIYKSPLPGEDPKYILDAMQEPASLGTDRGRWSSKKMSALRWRLDLINNELSEGIEKVIWMDISTLIASDMSCLYEKLSHFIYRVRS